MGGALIADTLYRDKEREVVMSCNSAYSSLFVICKTEEQRDELLARFQQEKPGYGEFVADLFSTNSHLYIDIAFFSSEVSHNLDSYILELDRWLYENFNLHLHGYWILLSMHSGRMEIKRT